MFLSVLLALAISPEQAEFFERRIRPLFAAKCYDCHGPKVSKPMGGLRLSSKSGLSKGGDSGPVVGGSADSSRLLRAVTYKDPTLQMPPKGKLSDTEIADLRRWVEMGAPDPRTDSEEPSQMSARKGIDFERARKWWSFQPLKTSPTVPGYVDAFLMEKLKEKGLKSSAPADRRTLIRRLSLDVTGLPPTPEEVALFLQDQSSQAYERLVDRMLASPHYGERWARHWLDLVRFAETDGHEFDVEKPNAWRYRDYVIRALNGDLPYDQFVREQIAGDLLPNARPEAAIATGMHFMGEVLNSPVDALQSHADRVDNQIDVFGKTFLGLTLGCARCHDHKFDPLPTSDYYALASTFYSSRRRQSMVNPPSEQIQMKQVALKAATNAGPPKPGANSSLPAGYRIFDDFNDPGLPGWTATGYAFHQAASDGMVDSARLSPVLEGQLISDEVLLVERYVHVRMRGSGLVRFLAGEYRNPNRALKADPTKGFTWQRIDVKMEQGQLAYFVLEDSDPLGGITVDKIVFSENPKPPGEDDPNPPPVQLDYAERVPPGIFALTAWDNNPHDTKINIRGNPSNLGATAPRGFLTLFSGANQVAVPGSGRLELAEKLFRDASALVARVMVNRIWKHHFGSGLVATVDNFGLSGDRPTHPQLLDTMAQRFIDSGWSIKNLHRDILLSNAYRMASTPEPQAEAADPDNKLLHRYPIRRLEAEALRDMMLAVSGSLDRNLYGPSILPWLSPAMEAFGRGKPKPGPLDGFNRRSIYIQVRRNFISDFSQTFDFPQPIAAIGKRNVSTVASQALYMMNGDLVNELARRWAEKTEALAGNDEEKIAAMYETAFSRPPTQDEFDLGRAYLAGHDHSWQAYAHVLMSTTEFAYVR